MYINLANFRWDQQMKVKLLSTHAPDAVISFRKIKLEPCSNSLSNFDNLFLSPWLNSTSIFHQTLIWRALYVQVEVLILCSLYNSWKIYNRHRKVIFLVLSCWMHTSCLYTMFFPPIFYCNCDIILHRLPYLMFCFWLFLDDLCDFY